MEIIGNLKISLIIRTFNEEKYIGNLLNLIEKQDPPIGLEIIVVDSGSIDSTLEIVKKYPVKIVQIEPERFSFGYSLNRGIEEASGDLCIIVSAHCYPKNTSWLANIIKPFSDEKVAMVYGRQIGNHITKYSESQIFATLFPDYSIDDLNVPFCNNANSAIRKSVWEKRGFNEKVTGLEDLDWARYLKSKKYKISYRSDAVVYHIHDETYGQIYHRYFREGIAFREIFKGQTFSFLKCLKLCLLNIFSDYFHSIRDLAFFKNIFSIPIFRATQFWATYKANHHHAVESKELSWHLYYPRTFWGKKKKIQQKEKRVA